MRFSSQYFNFSFFMLYCTIEKYYFLQEFTIVSFTLISIRSILSDKHKFSFKNSECSIKMKGILTWCSNITSHHFKHILFSLFLPKIPTCLVKKNDKIRRTYIFWSKGLIPSMKLYFENFPNWTSPINVSPLFAHEQMPMQYTFKTHMGPFKSAHHSPTNICSYNTHS